jgi:hypothetical protein
MDDVLTHALTFSTGDTIIIKNKKLFLFKARSKGENWYFFTIYNPKEKYQLTVLQPSKYELMRTTRMLLMEKKFKLPINKDFEFLT